MPTSIRNISFKEGLPHDLEIVDMAFIYEQFKSSLTQTHRTDFYHIFWFDDGPSEHLIDFQSVRVKKDTLLFIRKGAVQKFDEGRKFSGKAILFTDAFYCRTPQDSAFIRSTILFNDLLEISQFQVDRNTSELHVLLEMIIKEQQRPKDAMQAEILHNLLHTFLLQCERERRRQGFREVRSTADAELVLRFHQLLDDHYRDWKTVTAFAESMGITEKKLNQATTKVIGKSAKEMISERIMLEARRLLIHTSDSVKEISYALGFEESTNFTKYFRKLSGMAPLEFREVHVHA